MRGPRKAQCEGAPQGPAWRVCVASHWIRFLVADFRGMWSPVLGRPPQRWHAILTTHSPCQALSGAIEFKFVKYISATKILVESVGLYPAVLKTGQRETRQVFLKHTLEGDSVWKEATTRWSASRPGCQNPPPVEPGSPPQQEAGPTDGTSPGPNASPSPGRRPGSQREQEPITPPIPFYPIPAHPHPTSPPPPLHRHPTATHPLAD